MKLPRAPARVCLRRARCNILMLLFFRRQRAHSILALLPPSRGSLSLILSATSEICCVTTWYSPFFLITGLLLLWKSKCRNRGHGRISYVSERTLRYLAQGFWCHLMLPSPSPKYWNLTLKYTATPCTLTFKHHKRYARVPPRLSTRVRAPSMVSWHPRLNLVSPNIRAGFAANHDKRASRAAPLARHATLARFSSFDAF